MNTSLNKNKKSFIIHPFFLCCFPVLFLLAFNAHELVVQDTFIPLIISISISFVFWIILRCFIDGKKAGLIVSLFIILFIIYGNTHTLLQSSDSDTIQFLGSNPILGTVFLIVGIFGTIFFIKTSASTELNTIFNIVAISIIAIVILNLVYYYASNQTEDITISDLVHAPIIINDVEAKPDVFVFILDEFAGEKQLKMDFNHDLTPFNQELEKRDFFIPDLSLSNYPHSFLSLASTLNMNYLDSLVEEADPNSKDMQLFIRLADRSTVLGMFDSYGYKVTTLTTVGPPLGYTGNYVDEHLCTFGEIHIELRKNLVLTYLPISYFNDQLLSHFNRDKLKCIFSYVEDYESDGKQPHFIHSHLMLPHGPFIYDSEGNNVSRDPNLKVDKEGYIDQLIFTEGKILELIDLIQKRSPESVIIVHSDHGYRQEINQANPTDEDLIRGFNNISAVYFPDKDIDFPEKLSLVNLYRIFFNTYFDTDYEILDDRQIWYDNIVPKPYVHTDMTNRLNSLI
tara:strand:+ start:987 stop:2519 length:1533 start_codon:yes stop_codon:yes gene_type:complete